MLLVTIMLFQGVIVCCEKVHLTGLETTVNAFDNIFNINFVFEDFPQYQVINLTTRWSETLEFG